MQEVFGRTPTELRATGRSSAAAVGCRLRLPFRAPFDGAGLFAYLGSRAIPGVEEVIGTTYRRTLAIGDHRGVVALALTSDGAVILDARLGAVSALAPIVRRARHLFDLDSDPGAISAHLSKDPKLRAIVRRRPGMRVPGSFDGFELATRAILGQQVSVKAATTLAGRIAARFGDPLDEPAGSLTHSFPGPARLAGAEIEAIGLPARRAATIRNLARAVADGAIVLDGTADREETKARLLELPGFGPWTVSYIAMRSLRDPDAFLPTDLGVKHATERLKIDGQRNERWSPWRAYATMYLWSSLSPA